MTETASLLSPFLGSFFAATLLPGGSEAVLFGMLKSYPETLWRPCNIAGLGTIDRGCAMPRHRLAAPQHVVGRAVHGGW